MKEDYVGDHKPGVVVGALVAFVSCLSGMVFLSWLLVQLLKATTDGHCGQTGNHRWTQMGTSETCPNG